MTTPPAHLHRQAMDALAGRPPGRGARAAARRRARVGRPRDPQRPRGGDGRGGRTRETARGVLTTVLAIDPAHAEARDNLAALERRDDAAGGRLRHPGAARRARSAAASRRRCWAASCRRRGRARRRSHARLTELPSATTVGERWFFHNYAAHLWSGAHDIFENGPLLGGTTRAIGIGMLANPRRDAGARAAHARLVQLRDRARRRRPELRPPDRARGCCAARRAPSSCAPATSAASSRSCTRATTTRRCCACTRRRCRARSAESHTMADLYEQDADGALRPRLRRRLQELVRHALVPRAHRADDPRPARTSSCRTSAGTRASGCRRWSACCPSTSASSRTSTTRTRSSCCGRSRPADVARFPELPDELGASGFERIYGALLRRRVGRRRQLAPGLAQPAARRGARDDRPPLGGARAHPRPRRPPRAAPAARARPRRPPRRGRDGAAGAEEPDVLPRRTSHSLVEV